MGTCTTMMGGKMQQQERQTSARLIIAVVALVLQLLTLLPVTECVRAYGGDPQLNAIYFNVLMSEGLDVNGQVELLQKALNGVQYFTERRQRTQMDERVEHQLAQLLALIHQNLVKLPLSNRTRTEMYEQLLAIIQPIIDVEI